MFADQINKKIYEKSATVSQYLKLKFILPEEELIFSQYEQAIRDKAVLEIGFGGGRITQNLSDLTPHYYLGNEIEDIPSHDESKA